MLRIAKRFALVCLLPIAALSSANSAAGTDLGQSTVSGKEQPGIAPETSPYEPNNILRDFDDDFRDSLRIWDLRDFSQGGQLIITFGHWSQ